MTGKAKAELLRNLDAATDVLKEAPAHTQPCLHERHRKYVLCDAVFMWINPRRAGFMPGERGRTWENLGSH